MSEDEKEGLFIFGWLKFTEHTTSRCQPAIMRASLPTGLDP